MVLAICLNCLWFSFWLKNILLFGWLGRCYRWSCLIIFFCLNSKKIRPIFCIEQPFQVIFDIITFFSDGFLQVLVSNFNQGALNVELFDWKLFNVSDDVIPFFWQYFNVLTWFTFLPEVRFGFYCFWLGFFLWVLKRLYSFTLTWMNELHEYNFLSCVRMNLRSFGDNSSI